MSGGLRPSYLAVENVTKRFGPFVALSEVSLEVGEGEFVCFLGPSGCGKTTLLRAIAGLDIQTGGRIVQAGRDISRLPPEQRDFGIVFQSYALFPNLSVAANIAFGLENRRMKRADINERVEALLRLIHLEERGGAYPAQLSGGQQQRVALARALAPNPGLILLDEPLSALDAKVRLHLRQELKQLQARLGVTTIMVTHDQEEALAIADRIVIMNAGRVEQAGTPQEIYDNPATRFVADFIGAMNFLPVTVTAQDRVRFGPLPIAVATGGRAAGSPAIAAIRPEDVQLGPAGDDDAGNGLAMDVGPVEFLGGHVRARLTHPACPDDVVIAEVPQAAARRLGLSAGARLPVSLPAGRLRLYDREAAHG
ncbi:putative 2-aminoethylphosphonate ABC transporter ATP-binding protein [Pseudoxanthobacter sp.]|uniref:putative 2-aminoethylphosphonate ABC transporter ATP-binding protein n=1 Tax=Pseudoxanthobacter sp. TaxID=1925742 RepID=UPI002FE2F8CE